jgi:hypothetical protein
MDELRDVWTIRMVVALIGLTVVVCLVGIIVSECVEKDPPRCLPIIASAALGALTGLLSNVFTRKGS